MQTVVILGRQPQLGMAELESLYGAASVQPLGNGAALVDAAVDFGRLGGAMKAGELLGYTKSTDWPSIVQHLADFLPKQFTHLPEGKLTIGLSLYGLGVNTSKINAGALTIKKTLKSAKRGIRIVPNKQPELNTAQVIHNRLTDRSGMEVLLVRVGKRVAVAKTIAVQDIDAYAARDQARPKRDARVGMLPPKLAQIIVNLAVGTTPNQLTVLDPFCGTGVVLQEAHLMGYGIYGTDIDSRMVEYSIANLKWLQAHDVTVAVGDATNHAWRSFDVIACETYLGRPLSSLPAPDKLQTIIADCDTIHRKFLENVAQQTKSGFRMCIAVPSWRTPHGFKHLKTLDSLESLGYNRMRFVHVETRDLLYHRPDQLVARELVVLERI